MKPALTICIILAAFLSGCSNPGIVQLAPGTYTLTRVDRAGIWGNREKLKAGVIREANQFATAQGKVAIPVSENTTPNYPMHCATYEYQFRLVAKNDPAIKTAVLVQRSDEPSDLSGLSTELSKLDDLRKRGVLTSAEFDAAKKKLLDR